MSGTADLICQGFGSWSTAYRIPTLGFTSAVVSAPVDGIIEYTVEDTRSEWTTRSDPSEWTTIDTRMEWTTEGPS